MAGRRFLFLQGLSTPLFFQLGQRLRTAGAAVERINLCAGDIVFWPGKATNFRGLFQTWAGFVTAFIEQREITDIILFGDCRPYHRVAIARARRRGIAVHVFEEGVLRPHWITMESDQSWRRPGVLTGRSLAEITDALPPLAPHAHVAGGFAQRAWWDVAFHACNIVFGFAFPRFRRHRPHHPFVEGLGWLRRAWSRPRLRREAEIVVGDLVDRKIRFFLLPLQLDSDAQIRFRSPFHNMEQVLDTVLASFAAAALPGDEILVKAHPLDNGLIDRQAQVARLAKRHGLAGRVHCIDGGHLPTIIEHSQGVVMVNSTLGLTALHQGRATFALAHPIYALPGLVAGGSLDDFWRAPQGPTPGLMGSFEKLLVNQSQINGSFFNFDGIDLAIDGIIGRLAATGWARPS